MMNKIRLSFIALACLLFGCQQVELVDPNEVAGQPMQTVTISAGMGSVDTKAALDTKTGAFSWQEGDVISVLATDGKFYNFTLAEGAGVRDAQFEGQIPEGTAITTVATYPAVAENGAANTILEGNTLKYILPTEWTYAGSQTNVPMVATFEAGAEFLSFKQIGGVLRFPVSNLPTDTKVVLEMHDKTVTGEFELDLTNLGEAAIVAGTEASTVTLNYTAEYPLVGELNIPVPTGVYNNFTLTVKRTNGDTEEVIFTKNYSSDINVVNRSTLLIMSELVFPEVAEVWPFFVDARILFSKHEGAEQFAAYIDGAEEPVFVEAEDWGERSAVLVGGNFEHNSTHNVTLARVENGVVVPDSKFAEVTFTTANVFQMTKSTGTRFVTAGWDDVAIGWGPKFENGQWTAVPKSMNPDFDTSREVKVHMKRGYEVQLLAADQSTVLYQLYSFAGHEAFTGTFSDSSWLGKVGGHNILIPTALAFGYLQPGTDYYFRVRTLDEPVKIGLEQGNFNPDPASNGYPCPYPLYSERGGCAWSKPVKMTTDAPHVPTPNEILYEGFDDMLVLNDPVNWAPAVVPSFGNQPMTWAEYAGQDDAEGEWYTAYPEFVKSPSTHTQWTTQAFSEQLRARHLGIKEYYYADDYPAEKPIPFNEAAGSLKGWSVSSNKSIRTIYPVFGAVRIGQSGSGTDGSIRLYTPKFNTDKLSDEKSTKCIVTAHIAYSATGQVTPITTLCVYQYRNGTKIGEEIALSVSLLHPTEYEANIKATHTDDKNYVHHQKYYEVKCEVYLKKGDQLAFGRPNGSSIGKGMIILGDVKVEVVPNNFDNNTFVDNGVGTEPDNTNYDIYGLGEFPITYWWTPPTRFLTTDEEALARYTELAESGINVVVYNGEVDRSLAENKRILNICERLGLKFFGQLGDYWYEYSSDQNDLLGKNTGLWDLIAEHFIPSPAYLGEYVTDEPNVVSFDQYGELTKQFLSKFPNKDIYINLFPMVANAVQLGTSTYEQYLREYMEKVPTKAISYDYYGLGSKAALANSYYTNLDMVRTKTLGQRMPYWVITQAGQVGSSRKPTELDQRWTVMSTIALGSKGISYFCYWTPSSSEFNEEYYMIDGEGNKTEFYHMIKKINADIKTYGQKLMPCHADGAIMTSYKNFPLYDNDGKGRTKYGPVLRAWGSGVHVLCGCFRDARVSENGDNFKGYKVMVTHEFPQINLNGGTFNVYLQIDKAVQEITVTHNNTSKTVQLTNTLNENISDVVSVSFDGSTLIVTMPEGEAALVEF